MRISQWSCLAIVLVLIGAVRRASAVESLAATEEDGMGILIEALQNSGFNRNLIWSGRLKFTHRFEGPIPEGDKFESGLAQWKKQHLEYMKSIPKHDPRNRKLAEEQLADAKNLYARQVLAVNRRLENYEVLFEGASPFDRVKEKVSFPPLDGSPETREPLLNVGGTDSGQQQVYLSLNEKYREVNVSPRLQSYPINEFGRMRGDTAVILTGLFFVETDELSTRRFQFNPESVEKAKEVNRKLLADFPNMGVRVLGREPYDELHNPGEAFVVQRSASQIGQIHVGKMKAWIDPTRGHICPRIEVYREDTLVNLYLGESFFLDENSGLWWPGRYQIHSFDPQTGDPIGTDTFEFNAADVDVNVPIDDSEFVIPITPGYHVIDRREHPVKAYRSMGKLSLSSANGSLDLSSFPELKPAGSFKVNPPSGRRTLTGNNFRWQFLILVAVNVCAVLGVIVFLIRRRLRRRTN